jgi:hypothetical protein
MECEAILRPLFDRFTAFIAVFGGCNATPCELDQGIDPKLFTLTSRYYSMSALKIGWLINKQLSAIQVIYKGSFNADSRTTFGNV